MQIIIYAKYKVRTLIKACDISQEDSTPGDYVYTTNEYDHTEILDGGKVIDRISKLFQDKEFCNMSIENNILKLNTFNPTYGTGCDYTIIISELEE